MRRDYDDAADDDPQPVIVPRSGKTLAAASPERARRLRAHLTAALRKSRTIEVSPSDTADAVLEPEGFAARVARTACAMCKGWCCKGGGDHAYLDARTMARVRGARPELRARDVLLLYVERAPVESYGGSCVFHGQRGCALTPALRSDVCNAYFCGGLDAFLTSGEDAAPTIVIAGEGGDMRTSPILRPPRGR